MNNMNNFNSNLDETDDSGIGSSKEDSATKIFAALDEDNRGFISSQQFLEKMVSFMASDDVTNEELSEDIYRLIQPYDRIGIDEFRTIFKEILDSNGNRSNRNSQIRMNSTESLASNHSASDIDNSEEQIYIVKDYKSNKTSIFQSESSVMASPRSAKAVAKELNDRINNTIVTTNNIDMEEVNSLREEIDQLTFTNEELEKKNYQLESQLNSVESRMVSEKMQVRLANERVSNLEAQLHNEQLNSKEKLKQQLDEYRLKMDVCERECEEKLRISEDKYNQLEIDWRNLKQSSSEYNDQLDKLKAQMKNADRDVRNLLTHKSESETILSEYKRTVGDQISELQAERDMLEMTVTELMSEIQILKHLPQKPTQSTLSRSQSSGPSQLNDRRPRALSDYISVEMKRNSTSRLSTIVSSTDTNIFNIDTGTTDTGRIINMLTQENRNLVERIAHLETVSYYQRQKLEASANCLSLADELEQLDLTELRNALAIERETVKTLQRYIANLTTKLIMAGHIDVFEQA